MSNKYDSEIKGSFAEIDGDEFYKISNVQDMTPFFINIASNSDIWMYLSSNGSLSAGRKDAGHSIFPYETDDKIHIDTYTGPKTFIKVEDTENKKILLWEPFDKSTVNPYDFTRNLYKNIWGNALIYEEVNYTLGLSFRYKWESSEKFGIVRTSCIVNLSDAQKNVAVFDGVRNIMPYGIAEGLPSCLADAYKHAELDNQTNIAIYSLTSKIADTPNPIEILNANIVWSILSENAENNTVLLSTEQLKKFCKGENIEPENLFLGKKCAYFTYQTFKLEPDKSANWTMIMDVGLNQCDIASLQNKIHKTNKNIILGEIRDDIKDCTRQLQLLIASADGMQKTNDSVTSKHHFINVLYNNMRGGVFDDGYYFDYDEFIKFVNMRNKFLIEKQSKFFESVKNNESKTIIDLKEKAYKTGNADIIRICMEFLPICFSRRHGDPSRPWNRFFINLKTPDGKKLYHYEGNWRDIFQNWEAMCLSFPEYIENIIAKFVNASTADGFNPYRINTEGIDWEVPEPHNPFAGMGYWGDHQIVYLTKLLEALYNHNPKTFEKFFENDVFTYANIPYRIKDYESICENSKQTIIFDFKLHDSIMETAKKTGSDGKLILKENGQVYYVSFMEKLIVPILAKLSNLVIGGGIWMNTQRPEWNDANNAIVGNGLSMVTVYQLRRHIILCKKLISAYSGSNKTVDISNEAAEFILSVISELEKHSEFLNDKSHLDYIRSDILDNLGYIFSQYREKIYNKGFSGKSNIKYDEFTKLFDVALKYIDHTIELNKTSDGFYNAYNILRISKINGKRNISVSEMYPMLEGQTAVAGCGKLSPDEIDSLIETMENSGLYSNEQNTFYLYPLKKLKTFMQKNIVPENISDSSELIKLLIKNNNTKFVVKDENGCIRLNPDITEFKIFVSALNELRKDEAYKILIKKEFDMLCECYETMFKHSEFTGRSGIMYKFEGIGCVYWHQNAKFLLSLGESFVNACQNIKDENPEQLQKLKEDYYRLRQGLGFCKEPKTWGAFPLDPYSHTAYLQGAQQPGMTGQVKEEILTRRLELGVIINNGLISFLPDLLKKSEFLETAEKFLYFDVNKQPHEIQLEKDTLAFTLCQVPVVYKLADENKIFVEMQDKTVEIIGQTISKELSEKVFLRDGEIKQIIVNVKL